MNAGVLVPNDDRREFVIKVGTILAAHVAAMVIISLFVLRSVIELQIGKLPKQGKNEELPGATDGDSSGRDSPAAGEPFAFDTMNINIQELHTQVSLV